MAEEVIIFVEDEQEKVTVLIDDVKAPITVGEHYSHNQPGAASIWNVAHNLNKNPAVSVVDTSGKIIIGDILYVDINNVRLTFNNPFAGKAYFN